MEVAEIPEAAFFNGVRILAPVLPIDFEGEERGVSSVRSDELSPFP